MIGQEDLELLEQDLDGALGEPESSGLRARLSSESALASARQQLVSDRELRSAWFATLGGDDEATGAQVDRIIRNVRASMRRAPHHPRRWLGAAVAAAACIAVGVMVGRDLPGHHPAGGVDLARTNPAHHSPVQTVVSYQVELKDAAGKVMAVERFDSLDKARQFSEDLDRWQARQREASSGKSVVLADKF
jgi:hypothetical protein